MNLALKRLDEVDAVTATLDDDDVLDMDISNLTGGAIVTIKFLAEFVANAQGVSLEEVVATARRFIDGEAPKG